MMAKRDDLFQVAGGGSKARMLQYILAGGRDYDVLVTAGNPNSNFNRACALMCAKLKIPMHLVEYAESETQFEKSLNYKICTLAGVKKNRCTKEEVYDTIKTILSEYEKNGLNVKYVYGGGKCLEGIYSYFDAIQEIYLQNIKVDYIFVACGTGTTLTGICAGVQKYYPNTKVYAISVSRTWENEKKVLTENMVELNNFLNSSYTFDNLTFIDDYLCGGYASINTELINRISECISNEGMLVDPIYSGKAFSGMCNIIEKKLDVFKNKNILFWNTGAMFNLISLL